MEYKIILEYKAEKYAEYILAQSQYNLYHKFSDLVKMLDNGIACNMYSQDELKSIIAKQDEMTQKILIAQFGKYIIVNAE